MPLTYLLLGANLGDRKATFQQARHRIEATIGETVIASSIYETAAWGLENQQAFLNQVLAVQTQLPPLMLLSQINFLEAELGRVREIRWGARVIDIDILFYGDLVLQTQRLTIPHPELANRRFTLVPLSEIVPDLVHPVLQLTTTELLALCPDNLRVNLFTG
jgi:2-amino-4-hydroxy-6-hydroxymethyldihydropteridine diphosphokinase